MGRILLIRGARQLITLGGVRGPRRGSATGGFTVIQDGSVLIQNGRIQEVGQTRRIEKLAISRDAEVIEAAGKVIIPAFVDCHARLLCGSGHSGDEDTAAAVRAVRGYTPQRLELEGRKRIRLFLRHGTVTLGASCGYGQDDVTELKALRVLRSLRERPVAITPCFFGASQCSPEFNDRPEDYLEWVRSHLLPLIRQRDLASIARLGDGFPAHALDHFARHATHLGFSVHVHSSGADPTKLRPSAAAVCGLEDATPPTVQALASSGATAILTPGVTFAAGQDHFAPARDLLDAAVPIALATGFDNLACPTMSLPMIIAIACSQMRMTPAEALAAATIHAAHTLGLAHRTGSLEADKDADLLLLHCPDYRDVPRQFGLNPVAMAIRKGEIIYPHLEES